MDRIIDIIKMIKDKSLEQSILEIGLEPKRIIKSGSIFYFDK